MYHSGTTRLIDYWSSLNGGQTPARADFDPIQASDLLPQMFLLAREGDRLAFRIAGETLRGLFGRSLKGSDVFALFSSPALARRTALDAVREGAAMVLIGVGRTSSGGEVPLEIVLAPVLGPDGATDRLIGLIQPTASLVLLEGQPIADISVRMASASTPRKRRPALRLAAQNGQRIA